MRGEDRSRPASKAKTSGSPPHARGRPDDGTLSMDIARITPACAGKTFSLPERRRTSRDHPRMRGEDQVVDGAPVLFTGSPPHARGRPTPWIAQGIQSRITPACAGKTIRDSVVEQHLPDHPRMRGEDGQVLVRVERLHGSPPHARGRRPAHTVR